MGELIEAQTDAMLRALAVAVPDDGAFYVSTPITTGRRFVLWRRGRGHDLDPNTPEYERGLNQFVKQPNIAQAKPIVSKLRQDGHCVIDPTALVEVDGWRQQHYHDLWIRVIERFVVTVVFVDGWEYSVGAVKEMDEAVVGGQELLSESLEPLSPHVIVDRIESAISDVQDDNVLPVGELRAAFDSVRAHFFTSLDPSERRTD